MGNDNGTLGAPVLDILGKLDVTIGDFGKEMRERRQRDDQARNAEVPRFIPIHASVVVGATGIAVMRFDNAGPDQGHFWYIRKLIVGGLTTTTVAAGRADIFVTAAAVSPQATLASVGIADWQDQLAALPGILKPGEGEIVLRHNEELWVLLSGATNGQQYVAVGKAEDYQESASRQTWLM